jgi:outer membrane biosynthesis protein TonB
MRHHRVVLMTSLLAIGMALSGCSSMDPTEWFSTKKPLPGERKDMFPQGVPGVPQGVPPELVEGYTPPVEPVPEPLPVQEPKAKPKPKPRPKVAAAPRPAAAPAPRQQQTQQQGGTQAPWPDAPAQRQAAPASQSQSVFPDPPRR